MRWIQMTIILLSVGLGAGAQTPPDTLPSSVRPALVLEPGPGNPRNSEGDFVALKDGRILFVYTHFTGGGDDDATAHLAGRFSSDGGRTWTLEDTVLVPNVAKYNTMSVSLLRLESGAIAFFYLRKETPGDCRLYLRYSTDEAKSWTEPKVCMDVVGSFVVNNDRVIQLANGRLVIPAARHSLPGEDFRPRAEAMCFLSDDDGQTWRASTTVIEPPAGSKTGLQEPGVIELKDGRLMMLCRTDLGSQYRAYSSDGGDTWTTAEATDILSPVSPATFERIPSTGDILLVWNNHKDIAPNLQEKRTPLTLALSHDEGMTWQVVRNIEENPEGWYCYTAMEIVDDHVLLGYCAGDTTIGGLNRTKIVRFPVQWLYGK